MKQVCTPDEAVAGKKAAPIDLDHMVDCIDFYLIDPPYKPGEKRPIKMHTVCADALKSAYEAAGWTVTNTATGDPKVVVMEFSDK